MLPRPFKTCMDLIEKLSTIDVVRSRACNLYYPLVSLAQDHRDREWTDGRRSRQGPMTGWSWTLAAFRGSFAVPRGTIYYRGSEPARPKSISPRPERGWKRGLG